MSVPAGSALAAAAAALAGTPFRLHGRDPRTGLDCIGLVARALRDCGQVPVIPEGYALRALSIAPLLRFAGANGFVAATGPTAPGDLLLLRPNAIQAHCAVALAEGAFVHAHAGLGKVAIEAGPPAWTVIARWRLNGAD